MMKFYIDENLSPALAAELRQLGFDATHTYDYRRAGEAGCATEGAIGEATPRHASHLLPLRGRFGRHIRAPFVSHLR
jgi:hypothetical protein